MQCFAHLCFAYFHQQSIFKCILCNLFNFIKILCHDFYFFGA